MILNANENQKRNIEFKSTVLFQKYAFENAIPNENTTSLLKIYVRLINFSILPVASFVAKGAPFELYRLHFWSFQRKLFIKHSILVSIGIFLISYFRQESVEDAPLQIKFLITRYTCNNLFVSKQIEVRELKHDQKTFFFASQNFIWRYWNTAADKGSSKELDSFCFITAFSNQTNELSTPDPLHWTDPPQTNLRRAHKSKL